MSRPQVIDDEEHERVHDRVAAVDVAKDSGVVCTRTPLPSRPGARRSTVWTVKARMKAIRGLGRQLKKDGIEVVTLESTSVLSIAASVTPSSDSQPAIVRSDRQNVLNLRTVTVRSPGRSPGSRTATQTTFLCTSARRPADRRSPWPASCLPPIMDTGAPPAEPATRSRSCETRSQQQSGVPTGRAPASV